MGDHANMQSNFDVIDLAPRRNSSIDMEGYSLLPDIIWTPSPDMLNSQYGKVIFLNVKDSYPTNEDLLCTYTIMTGVDVRDDDKVAIFCVGWTSVKEVIAWVPAVKRPSANGELSVVFPACRLPGPGSHFYQFCYLNCQQVKGASIPFNFINKANVNPTQINIVFNEDNCLQGVAPGHTEIKISLPCDGPSSDVHIRESPAQSVYPSSEATSSATRVYKNHSTPAFPSTSHQTNNDHGDGNFNNAHGAQFPGINDLQKKIFELECAKHLLQSTLSAMSEENQRLKLHLGCESDKNQALISDLQRAQAEVEMQRQRYDLYHLNNKVLVTELEMKVEHLLHVLREKNERIVQLRQELGGVNEGAIALAEPIPFPPPNPSSPNPGDTDGQLEQQGHVDIGANNCTLRQEIRTSTRPSPFFAALQKTRNYYGTFLSDKTEIEMKLYSITSGKLRYLKNLHAMSEKKELLLRLEYQYYSRAQYIHQMHINEGIRIYEAMAKLTDELDELNSMAEFEVITIDEVKRRLEINRQNTCILREKAIEVFNQLLASYNYSMERNSGAAQGEVQRIQTLYSALDLKFMEILGIIERSKRNNCVWH